MTAVAGALRGWLWRPSKRAAVRVQFRTLISLALCAAGSAAALAHFAIDIVGDFALRHDTYDGMSHGSREYAAGFAIVFAVIVASRGLRACCDLAQRARGRIAQPELSRATMIGYVLLAVAVTCLAVPAMQWLDDAFAAVPLAHLGDAFGGSLLLGLITTLSCAAFVAALFFAFARWLLEHRDVIVAIVATLLRRCEKAVVAFVTDLDNHGFSRQASSAVALSLAKRGPPVASTIS